jgi:hypothetical protein
VVDADIDDDNDVNNVPASTDAVLADEQLESHGEKLEKLKKRRKQRAVVDVDEGVNLGQTFTKAGLAVRSQTHSPPPPRRHNHHNHHHHRYNNRSTYSGFEGWHGGSSKSSEECGKQAGATTRHSTTGEYSFKTLVTLL